MSVCVRYMNGDEITLSGSTVNALKVELARIHDLFAPDITLLTENAALLRNGPVPDRVLVVCDKKTYDDEMWHVALLAHAKEHDIAGLTKITGALENASQNATTVTVRCSEVLLAYLRDNDVDVKCVEKLLECGASVHATDHTDLELPTPLMLAARMGQAECCQLLVQFGAPIDKVNHLGDSALHWGAGEGRLDVCRALVACKANMECQDEDGETPLCWAARNGFAPVCDFLCSLQGDDGNALRLAAENGHPDVCAGLLNHGSPTVMTIEANILIQAARFGHCEVVQVLLHFKADVNAENADYETALSVAEEEGEEGVCTIVIAAGAHRKKVSVVEEDVLMTFCI